MSQSRKLRRQLLRAQAKKKGAPKAKSPPASEDQKAFEQAIDELAVIGGFSNHVSMAVAGTPTNSAGELASMVHGKMCAHARSIGAVSKSSMFDHSAIISLARMVVEGMTMFFYLLEKTDGDEWALRHLVLRLHDTAARIKLMRVTQPKSEYADLTQGRAELIAEIEKNPGYGKLDEEQQKRLLTGEVIFIRGMRNAALAAGWREETFQGIYNYFSVHAHSAPMSYMRMRSHAVDYYSASDLQYSSSSLAVGVATACLRRVSLRCLDNQPDAIDKFSAALLPSIRQEDAECKVFNYGA